jgi:hypothetical protein
MNRQRLLALTLFNKSDYGCREPTREFMGAYGSRLKFYSLITLFK